MMSIQIEEKTFFVQCKKIIIQKSAQKFVWINRSEIQISSKAKYRKTHRECIYRTENVIERTQRNRRYTADSSKKHVKSEAHGF